MRNRTKVFIVVSLIASFFIGVGFADKIIPLTNSVSVLHNSVSDLTNSVSELPNKIQLTKNDNRIPIAVYHNCRSFLRTDMKTIETFCDLPQFEQKRFKFSFPTALELGLHDIAMQVNSNVYQYSANDFKIGLYDQVGEKNYTVNLWQLP